MRITHRAVLWTMALASAVALTLGAAAMASGLDCLGANCIKQQCAGPCESMGVRNCPSGKIICCCRPMGAWECSCCAPASSCGCSSPNCCYSGC